MNHRVIDLYHLAGSIPQLVPAALVAAEAEASVVVRYPQVFFLALVLAAALVLVSSAFGVVGNLSLMILTFRWIFHFYSLVNSFPCKVNVYKRYRKRNGRNKQHA